MTALVPQEPMALVMELESEATVAPETSRYQTLSQGKRSAGPPLGPPVAATFSSVEDWQ